MVILQATFHVGRMCSWPLLQAPDTVCGVHSAVELTGRLGSGAAAGGSGGGGGGSVPRAWCEARGLALEAVSPLHVATYIRTHLGSAPTVKQHLAAIRMLGDWLVVSQVLPVNPAEARRLLEAIDTGTLELSDKIARRAAEQNRLSRRSTLTGLAGIGVAVLAWIFPRQEHAVRDVRISAGGRHDASGGGEPRIKNIRASFTAGAPSWTARVEVVPAEPPADSGQVLRV